MCDFLNLFKWPSLLNPMLHSPITAVDMRNNRRFPIALTLNKKARLPAKFVPLKIDAVKFASNGTPYALTTCMMYGDQTASPLATNTKPVTIARINGFKTRFCFISLTLPQNVVFSIWWHCVNGTPHNLHAFCTLLCLFKETNSSWTSSADTQPRSHFMAFRASFGRFLDSNQLGVSGI